MESRCGLTSALVDVVTSTSSETNCRPSRDEVLHPIVLPYTRAVGNDVQNLWMKCMAFESHCSCLMHCENVWQTVQCLQEHHQSSRIPQEQFGVLGGHTEQSLSSSLTCFCLPTPLQSTPLLQSQELAFRLEILTISCLLFWYSCLIKKNVMLLFENRYIFKLKCSLIPFVGPLVNQTSLVGIKPIMIWFDIHGLIWTKKFT